MIPIPFAFRAVLAWLWFLLVSVLCFLLLPFFWRTTKLNYVFSQLSAPISLALLGWHVKIENKETLTKNQPCVYVGNHQSNFDVFTMGVAFPPHTGLIGKFELLLVPFFGFFFWASGNILIRRKNKKQSWNSIDTAKKALLEKRLSIWMYPEGHRNHGALELLPFKKGAFHLAIAAQVPIVPMVSQHLHTYYHPRDWWALWTQRPGNPKCIRLKILDPVSTLGLTPKDIDKLTETVRKKMHDSLAEISRTF